MGTMDEHSDYPTSGPRYRAFVAEMIANFDLFVLRFIIPYLFSTQESPP